jgi:sugar (pentulose or hexulose) kinase
VSFIGIDLGTSFIKIAVMDLDTCALQRVRRIPFPEPIAGLDPLRCEFNPEDVLSAVRELFAEISDLSNGVEGVVMCTQMSCLVMMDREGKVRSNCIGWRDQRVLEPHPSNSGSYYQVLKARITEQQRRELGNELPSGAPICFLFWMVEQRKLDPGLIPVSLADFVASVLCDSAPSVDRTNAMAYELLNLSTLRWHSELIRELALDKLQWPPILAHGEIVGKLQIGNKKVPCYTTVGDYQCALAGGLLDERELSLNISTGSQVSRLTEELVLGNYQTRPFFDGKFTNTISHLPAGRSLNVLVGLITELPRAQQLDCPDPWQYIADVSEESDSSDLKVNLGFFPGPRGNQGGIFNIREQNLTVGSLFRAAFENMAENYSECADLIWPDRSWQNIVFSGGLVRKNGLLQKIIQQKFKTSYRLCPLEEDTLLGLMALALVFSKRVDSVKQAMWQLRSHYSEIETVPNETQ